MSADLESVLEEALEKLADEDTGELSKEDALRVSRAIRDTLAMDDCWLNSRKPSVIADFVCRNAEGLSMSAAERYIDSLTDKQVADLMWGDVFQLLQPGLYNDIDSLADENYSEKYAAEAGTTTAKIVESTIAILQALTDCTLSGGDSQLENVWEEICVQVQDEESGFWNVYVETIDSILLIAVEALKPGEQLAQWLETEGGADWQFDNEDKDDDDDDKNAPPVDVNEVVGYLRDLLLTEAADFENENIRHFLDGDDSDDEEEEVDDDAKDNGDPASEIAEFIQSSVEGKSLTYVAQWIADNVPPADRPIALNALDMLKVLEGACVTLSFRVAHVLDRVPVDLYSARSVTAYTFSSAISCVEVWVNGADVTGKVGVSYETILEELVRAAALGAGSGSGVLCGTAVALEPVSRGAIPIASVGGRDLIEQQAIGRVMLT